VSSMRSAKTLKNEESLRELFYNNHRETLANEGAYSIDNRTQTYHFDHGELALFPLSIIRAQLETKFLAHFHAHVHRLCIFDTTHSLVERSFKTFPALTLKRGDYAFSTLLFFSLILLSSFSLKLSHLISPFLPIQPHFLSFPPFPPSGTKRFPFNSITP